MTDTEKRRENRSIDRRDFVKAAGATAIVGTAGCLDDLGGGDDNYTIGMVDSLTGSLAPYGERNERGRELALSAINEVGIQGDGELDVLVEDDESENQGGVNAAQKLVNQEEVPLLIGSVGSGVSLAIHDSVVKGNDVVQISQNSTSPLLTDEPELLRISPSGQAKGTALAKLLSDDGHDQVAVTWINNDYGDGLQGVFEAEFPGEVVYNEPHDQGQSSYRGELTEMADTDATAWLFVTYADEVTVMINEAYDQGYNEDVEYYGAESTIADEILENTEPGSQDGFTGITESAPVEQDNYQNYRSSFEEEYDESPTVWSAYAYDAVTIAALAIHLADDFTGSAISEVVRDVTRPDGQEVYTYEEAIDVLGDDGSASDINYEGVSGPVNLDENGDPPGFYQIYTVEDHEYEFGDFITG